LRKKPRNDDEPPGSLSFIALKTKNKEMTTSRGGSPSSTRFEKKNKEITMSRGSSPSSPTLEGKKKQRNDDEPGRLTIISYT
jgi:hypothetical protein